jgi:hypothetical protein
MIFKWQGSSKWFYCGTWPTVSLASIRQTRDKASQKLKEGINPIDAHQAQKIDAQNNVLAVIEDAQRKKTEALTVKDLFDAWVEDGVARQDGNKSIGRMFNKDVLPASHACFISTDDRLNGRQPVQLAHRIVTEIVSVLATARLLRRTTHPGDDRRGPLRGHFSLPGVAASVSVIG